MARIDIEEERNRANCKALTIMQAREVSDVGQETGIGQGEKTGLHLYFAD